MDQNKSSSTILKFSNTTFPNAHGKIPYGMTNDYMFRAVLQSNNKVLHGLICSLLHLSEKEVFSVEITNPIILGKSIESKELRLDINVLLNNRTLINLEMQITNRLNWQTRSVLYLCRSYDQLNHGQDYAEIKPTVHIGFLDFTLFQKCPEFYATYKLINVKNQNIYSDNLTLCVVDLTKIDLATEEDKRYQIDCWAALFKAETWEEIRMLASKNEYIKEAAETIFKFNTDAQIRKQCLDREEYYQDMRNYERVILEKDNSISSYKKVIAEKDNSISSYKKVILEKDNSISSYEKVIEEKDNSISSYEKVITEKDNTIAEKEAELAAMKEELARVNAKLDEITAQK